MSDDDFGDDSFLVDDSFLREVDHITASVSSSSTNTIIQPKNNGFNRSVSLHNPRSITSFNNGNNINNKGWTGVQRSTSGPSSRPLTKIKSTPIISSTSSTNSNAQQIRRLAMRRPPPPNKLPTQPSSDDYDIIPLEPESIAALDSFSTSTNNNNDGRLQLGGQSRLNSSGSTKTTPKSNSSGSGRSISNGGGNGFQRTNSFTNKIDNSINGFLQTHLNFRKEKQTTKGKIWDRTEFAETGRRIGASKSKSKGKGKTKAKQKGKRKSRDWEDDQAEDGEEDEDLEDDEDDGDEDDWGDIMAPAPKPFVDMNAPYEPQRHMPNSETIKTYIYPTNKPKRDYQFEIIKACFKDNCLVALPTGLGKTFVAGVVMLNFYRWFPNGKIVFLAPTKPLVNQQIEACQLSCGIPSKDAAVMTGQSVSAKERARLWEDRRVFYCTPQTLDNDLKKGSVDPRDIVLAVFDEAHKASGSYAYTTILAYITAHHPYFRVLALTATPGADVPRVQSVVDALHISRIEIREAEAPEIRKYMNEKRTEKHVVPMTDIIEEFRDRWAALMRPYVAKLVDKDILNDRDLDCKRLRPFRLTAKRMEIAKDRGSHLKWAFGSLSSLEKMARAMGHLLEFSLGMFHTILVEIAGGTDATGKKSNNKGSANSIRNNTEFQKLLRDVEVEMNMIRIGKDGKTKADKHPKMQKTLELLLAHFTQAEEEEETLGQKNDTRAMVFCSFRPCVLDVVDMLNQHSGLLRATKFVGQSQGKLEEDKGFNQKEQKKTINEFKDGKYNILVSTSIGEEGLDIGEVDFVVIYDMPKQSIKLLQRVGRTGRKRDGKVHVLMSENREDMNWETAQQTHRDIQEEILHSRNLELFEDVEPLLPSGEKEFPKCIEQKMDIDPWDPEDKKFQKTLAEAERLVRKEKDKLKKAESKKAKTTEKGIKGSSRGHEIPEGAQEGFKSVADLLRSAGKLYTAKEGTETIYDHNQHNNNNNSEHGSENDSEDLPRLARLKKRGKGHVPVQSESDDSGQEQDLDSLFAETGTNRKTSTSKSKKTVTKRTNTSVKAKSKSAISKTTKSKGVSLADIDMNVEEPEIDSDIDIPLKKKSKSRVEEEQEEENKKQSDRAEKDKSALDFFNSIGPIRRGMTRSPSLSPILYNDNRITGSPEYSPPPTPSLTKSKKHVQAQPVEKESSLPPSPEISTKTFPNLVGEKLTPRTAAAVGFSQIVPDDFDFDFSLSWDQESSSNKNNNDINNKNNKNDNHTINHDQSPNTISSPLFRKSTYNTTNNHFTPGGSMLPPPLPPSKNVLIVNSNSSSPFNPPSNNGNSNNTPLHTQPVRRLGLRRPRPIILSSAEKEPLDISNNNSPHISNARTNYYGQQPITIPTSEPDSPIINMDRQRRRVVLQDSSPIVEQSIIQKRRRQSDRRDRGNNERAGKKKNNKGPIGDYMDMDAALSGSDSGDTSEHSDSSIASSSDNKFAGNFDPTQAPKGYNQQAIYMAGLGTQAKNHGLNFKRDLAEEQLNFLKKARKPVLISDDDDDDEYDDDEDEQNNHNFRNRGNRGNGYRNQGLNFRSNSNSNSNPNRNHQQSSDDDDYELGSFVVDDEDYE